MAELSGCSQYDHVGRMSYYAAAAVAILLRARTTFLWN
jgi:hypothetical protein